jgi:hypothetical protein
MSILSQLAITQAQALASSTIGRFDFFVDSLDGKLKAYDATNTLEEIGGASTATDVGYTLTVPTDWDGTPANAQAALDELASRVKGIEGKTDFITVTAAIDLDDVKSKANSALQSGANHSTLTLNDGTNPHGTTKTDVGLSNLDNTSDLSKPISNATQTALNGKKDDFTENTAFNKNFGTASGDVLEGDTRTINAGEITTLSNTSGTNSGDETTTSIQTKRPIKTVNGVTLEGTGNIPISGTVEPLPICVLTSTNNTLTASQSTPSILFWNVETEKDTGFTHSNSSNNSRLQVDADGTYQIQANIRMFSAGQRVQFVGKYLIDGVVQSMPMGSSYIRNSGTSSDFWTCIINPPPVKLTAGQYIEVQIQVEAQVTSTATGTFQGSESTFSITKLQGVKGEAGPTGAGANIILQKDDSTVGTTTNTLNFEGNATLTDEGSGKTTVLIDGGQTWYKQQAVNTIGGTVNAAFGSPLECVPFSGTFEITVVETGVYVIYGVITTRANLDSDNGSLELAYGIDTGGGASIGPQPYRENMNAKKNKRNGIQGTWGNVSLTAGDKVHLFLSTLGDSTTWDSGEIFIQTWK